MALLAGRRLIDYAAEQIAPHVDDSVIIGGREGVEDVPRAGLGPLGGIAGALAHAKHLGLNSVLTIACDMPRLPGDLIQALLEREAAWCVDAPVLGHWPTRYGDDLRAYLLTDNPRAVRHWARSIGAAPVHAQHPIMNVNTPEDLMMP